MTPHERNLNKAKRFNRLKFAGVTPDSAAYLLNTSESRAIINLLIAKKIVTGEEVMEEVDKVEEEFTKDAEQTSPLSK